jgi:hypothetical protein
MSGASVESVTPVGQDCRSLARPGVPARLLAARIGVNDRPDDLAL